MGTNCPLSAALCVTLGDDDLCGAIDHDLRIVSLHEAVLALHDPALRIGEVLLRFWALGWSRAGRLAVRIFWRPSASRCCCASAAALSLASAEAFASTSSSTLAWRMRSARRFLSTTQSGVSSPVLSAPYRMSSLA